MLKLTDGCTFLSSALLTARSTSHIVKECRRMNLRQFVEPSLETGGILDGALFGESLQDCARVSVMGVLKICDEKKHGGTIG